LRRLAKAHKSRSGTKIAVAVAMEKPMAKNLLTQEIKNVVIPI